jgi:transcriptional regulator with XRE-family HTH domain
MREAAGISLRELGRRTDINSGRLSIIERGVPPTPEEARLLREVLAKALLEPTQEGVA